MHACAILPRREIIREIEFPLGHVIIRHFVYPPSREREREREGEGEGEGERESLPLIRKRRDKKHVLARI